MQIHLISITNITNIPSIRFLINLLIKKYNSQIIITERYLKNENNYYNNKNITFKNIDKSNDPKEFRSQSILKKVIKYLSLLKITNQLLNANQDRKLIITNNYQILFLLFMLRKKKHSENLKIIYIQYEMIEINTILDKFMSGIILKNAHNIDLAIFPEINRLKHFISSCITPPKKTFLLPNTCKPVKINKTKIKHNIFNNIPNDAFIVGHIGNIGEDNHFLNEFIQVTQKLSNKNIYFIFVGYLSGFVLSKLNSLNNDKIYHINKVPHQELDSIYPYFNLGLILYKGTSLNYEFAAPNKLYEYWSYGIPVIANKLQGLIDIFKIQEQGMLINMNNIKEFEDAILNYKKTSKDILIDYFNKNLSISPYLHNLNTILTKMI